MQSDFHAHAQKIPPGKPGSARAQESKYRISRKQVRVCLRLTRGYRIFASYSILIIKPVTAFAKPTLGIAGEKPRSIHADGRDCCLTRLQEPRDGPDPRACGPCQTELEAMPMLRSDPRPASGRGAAR